MGSVRYCILLWGFAALMVMSGFARAQDVKAQNIKATPQELYGALFIAVQEQHLFADSKTFADAVATKPVPEIMKAYELEAKLSGFDLKSFITRYFRFEAAPASSYKTGKEDICTHIRNLWPVLTRKPDDVPAGSSLLPLKYPYIVPGGRFREIYYWDSYFTMLGLRYSGKKKLMRFMVQNFADLIARYGHVPNGNRSYYLSRSQPPFFALMVDLLAQEEGNKVYQEFLPALRQEYDFWMDGAEQLAEGQVYRRVVRMGDGSLLNRYFSDSALPRDESWREDVATAARSARNAYDVYRNLRAAAESGWDFSSRWLENPQDLATIRTLDIVPVDLNSLLYHLEQVLMHAYVLDGDNRSAEIFQARSEARKQAINDYLWNDNIGSFSDYIISKHQLSPLVTAAGFFPLFFSLADEVQAGRVAATARKHLLKNGGLLTTTVETGQQWDAPNVWAPLQWIAVKGLENYGKDMLAGQIARNWTDTVLSNYRHSGALKEKYTAYQRTANAGGGEYPNQDGFGWTNGVFLALINVMPHLPAGAACNLR
ncbi:alpha,alpha-trehalase TreF [Pseudochrobactrum sp. HB0163]|uniref:alpha,alpha-trehalase TreF n=1 Tax=Pseudochrobactrum sp. HB0163 TaxID=3450708 RepID=UPI003F6DBAA2